MSCKRLLEEAIKRDPLFARAHASLAFCHIRSVQMMPGSEDIPMHEEAALRSAEHAVRLDASEARAHNALGWSLMYFREFERARSRFLISASLNPNDGSACIDRALALAFLGDQSAADETAEVAATLNPLGGEWFSTVRAIVHFMARRYEAAQQHFALGQTTLPDILAWHAANLTCLGRHAQAKEVMQHALARFRLMWCGRDPMKPEDFIGWFRHANMLRRPEDWDHVYNGFPKAELVGATQ
jgi:tetratricopeptide (TPR) repeat protein